jgi:class 3 adenylate cyclase
MQLLARPLIQQCGGQIVRELADNILAVFPEATSAVEAALAVRAAVNNACNDLWPDQPANFAVSIGIDHGKLLLIAGHDCFGDPVNIAFKLGEDVAAAGEILITENVRKQLTKSVEEAEISRRDVSLSGIEVCVYRL